MTEEIFSEEEMSIIIELAFQCLKESEHFTQRSPEQIVDDMNINESIVEKLLMKLEKNRD